MKSNKKLVLTLIILLGIAGGFILYLSQPYINGETAVLRTMPVDPFDIFRGQYITLRYELSTLDALENVKEGDAVFVTLKENADGIFDAFGVGIDLPKETIFIKGTVTRVFEGKMNVQYGIEQYFFERNAEFSTNDMDVEVKIDKFGQARITRLLRDGKPIEIGYKPVELTS